MFRLILPTVLLLVPLVESNYRLRYESDYFPIYQVSAYNRQSLNATLRSPDTNPRGKVWIAVPCPPGLITLNWAFSSTWGVYSVPSLRSEWFWWYWKGK